MSFDPAAPACAQAGIFGLQCAVQNASVVLLPVPFDATTSYRRGASLGPKAILQASHQLDLFDIDTGRPYEAGIVMLPQSTHIEALNSEGRQLAEALRQKTLPDAAMARANAIGDELNTWVHAQVRMHLQKGHIVGVVGGDHATPFGCIQAYSEAFADLGILHIDAHADLRPAYEGFEWSHASIMHNVITRTSVKKLVQVGIRDFAESEFDMSQNSGGRIVTYFDRDLADATFKGIPFQKTVQEIVGHLPQEVYVSFDIDGLDPKLCPNTGTPVPGGLQFQQAAYLLAQITRSNRRIVGFDLNEVAPGAEGSEWDGNVGARILYKLCGQAILAKKARATFDV